MPWFRHPIPYSLIQPDPFGPVRLILRTEVPMEVEVAPGVWTPLRRAIIDTGTNLCTFSTAWARDNDIRLPRSSSPFSLAVVFSDAHPPTVPPLVGLHNLLNYWRYTFDGASELPVATIGHMRFDTL